MESAVHWPSGEITVPGMVSEAHRKWLDQGLVRVQEEIEGRQKPPLLLNVLMASLHQIEHELHSITPLGLFLKPHLLRKALRRQNGVLVDLVMIVAELKARAKPVPQQISDEAAKGNKSGPDRIG